MSKYDYFIFDCDGVLYHSNDEIGQAFQALRYIKNYHNLVPGPEK